MISYAFKALDQALEDRDPDIIPALSKGLSEKRVIEKLAKLGVKGAIDPLVALYSWHNGTRPSGFTTGFASLVPNRVYTFNDLDWAWESFDLLKQSAPRKPHLTEGVGRYFSFLWDEGSRSIAVDLDPSAKTRVMLVNRRAEKPFQEIYPSFEAFLNDLIRANREKTDLVFAAASPESSVVVKKSFAPALPEPVETKGGEQLRAKLSSDEVKSASFHELEKAIKAQNRSLAKRLNRGLTESKLIELLKAAGVAGNIDPLIELYSWKNGAKSEEGAALEEGAFFRKSIFQFLDIEAAIGTWTVMKESAAQLSEMMEGTELSDSFQSISRYFPMLWDGVTATIAVDLVDPKHPVAVIDFELGPIRPAYDSFKEFLADAIQSINEGRSLSCFESEP